MEEKQILIKGLNVHYKAFGEGRPMLILHGWPSSSQKWVAVAELLAQQGFRVIVPDLPGFGQTPEPLHAWNTNDYIEWLREFCDTVEDLKKEFYLAGHSFGGGLAAKFAIKYNQRITRLFLISAATIRTRSSAKKFYHRLAKIAGLFSFLPYYGLFRKAFYKFILRKSDYIYQKGIMKETYINVVSEDLSHKLSSINVPTVIIWGSKDASTPLADAH